MGIDDMKMRSGSNWRSLVPFLLTAWSVPPGIDWLLECCCPNLYLSPFIQSTFFNPCLLIKEEIGSFFSLLHEKTHKRSGRSSAAFLLTFNQTKNPIFPSIFARKHKTKEETLLESFIEVFMGRHDMWLWERHEKHYCYCWWCRNRR